MVLNRQAVMSGYQAHKQQLEEAQKRKETTYTDHFVRIGDNESLRIRFAYNIATETGDNQMIVLKMHDYYVKADNRYVKALCANLVDKPCHWCQVANQAIEPARKALDAAIQAPAGPNREARIKQAKEALKAAYQKAAKDVFIIPVHVFVRDEEAGKWRTEGRLLQLTWGIKTELVKMFEQGAVWEDREGEQHTTHDITAGNFIYKRLKDDGGKVSYSLSYQGDSVGKFGVPTFEHVEKMILDSRPPKVLQDQGADDVIDMGEMEGELDNAFA